MIFKAVKKPIPVEVMQWDGSIMSSADAVDFGVGHIDYYPHRDIIVIHTIEGVMKPNIGDYVVKGPTGEFWFVRKEIFEATYEILP